MRFGKQNFRYVAEEDVYICPAGEKLTYYYTTQDNGLILHRYVTNARTAPSSTTAPRAKNDAAHL